MGQEPFFSIAKRAFELGLQYSPELLYPVGQEPFLRMVTGEGFATATENIKKDHIQCLHKKMLIMHYYIVPLSYNILRRKR